jgi:hypothetical protein
MSDKPKMNKVVFFWLVITLATFLAVLNVFSII